MSPPVRDTSDTSYGQASLLEKLGAVGCLLLHLPIVLAWTLATSPFHQCNKQKHWKRIVADRAFNYLTDYLNTRQLQYFLGTSRNVYETWAKANDLPIIIDELGQDGRLFWIGERRTDKIVLYLHGGAFLFPVQDFALSFWKYAKEELKLKGHDVGLAVLSYSLVPTASFPTQLHQAVLAISYFISSGISPSQIHLVGDSAGGNLVLQVISHILHPVPSVPPLQLPAPFAGVYLMSPWVSLSTATGSMVTNGDSDMLSTRGLLYWGEFVLAGSPPEAGPFLQASTAPEGWFRGMEGLTERMLITAGERECLRDVILHFGRLVCALHKKARLVVQDNGVHDDPHLDFLLPVWENVLDGKEKGKARVKVGALSPLIIDWLAEGWTV